jgi:hypothetical protein
MSIYRDMQRAAAGKFDCAKRAGNAAQFAAYAQTFIKLYCATNACNGINRADPGTGRVFAVMAHLRRGFGYAPHHFQTRHRLQAMQTVRLSAGRLTGMATNT